jgi:hypothetical protein
MLISGCLLVASVLRLHVLLLHVLLFQCAVVCVDGFVFNKLALAHRPLQVRPPHFSCLLYGDTSLRDVGLLFFLVRFL